MPSKILARDAPRPLVHFDIFLLHRVEVSLCALPISQSSVPSSSDATEPYFHSTTTPSNYDENEVCQFAIPRTRLPEEAVLHGGPGVATKSTQKGFVVSTIKNLSPLEITYYRFQRAAPRTSDTCTT